MLKFQDSALVLARGLADIEVAEACATALADLGSRARPALPQLEELLAKSSLAVRNSEGVVEYSVEASNLSSTRIAAARAIAAIVPDRAREVLTDFATDRDVGGVVRRLLRALR
jgi:HEAT repeat protein